MWTSPPLPSCTCSASMHLLQHLYLTWKTGKCSQNSYTVNPENYAYFRFFIFTRNLIFMVVVVSTISASARVTVSTIFHVFNFRGSGQPRIIPVQRKFPELRYDCPKQTKIFSVTINTMGLPSAVCMSRQD